MGLVAAGPDSAHSAIGADGGLFAFGDARFRGSRSGIRIHVSKIVGLVPTG
jgi:hypothetical protein